MRSNTDDVSAHDLWRQVRQEALLGCAEHTPSAHYFEQRVLRKDSIQDCLAELVSAKLGCDELRPDSIKDTFMGVLATDGRIMNSACQDLKAIYTRDPACMSLLQALLFSRGFQALQAYRVSHALWGRGKVHLALLLHNRVAERFCVDIHPAAVIGQGVFIDHGHGVVIGETAVVDDDVSILHEVTLGGTGKERGDRHPKIRKGVLLSAGAKVLGRVVVGESAKVAACSVVLSDVPAFVTVAGIPARVVGPSAASTSPRDESLLDPALP